jgi:WD40 repeat protein
MRLLPRSPRGTWLLAGTVWVAGCGALWWALPVQPRVFIPNAEIFVGFLDDGKTALIALPDSTIVRYDAGTGRERSRFSLKRPAAPPQWVFTSVSNDSRFLAWTTATDSPTSVLIWDLAAGQPFADLPGSGGVPVFSPDSRHVATTGDGKLGRLRVWDLSQSPPTYRELADAEASGVRAIGRMSFTPDGHFLAVMKITPDGNGAAVWWRTDTWELAGRHAIDLTGAMIPSALDVTFLANGRLAAIYPGAPSLLLIDPLTGDSTTTPWPAPPALEVGPSARTGRYIASITWETGLWEWLRYHASAYGLNLPPRMIGAIVLIDQDTGREHGRLPQSWTRLNGWSPDGSVLAAKVDGGIALWDVPPRKPLTWLLGGCALLALPLAGLAWWRGRPPRSRQ